MKPAIHPQYYPASTFTCSSCHNTFTAGSTKQSVTVEVCYKCHPYYTGEHRFLDTKGRVDLFQKKQQTAKIYQSATSGKKHRAEKKEEKQPKTLRELLGEV